MNPLAGDISIYANGVEIFDHVDTAIEHPRYISFLTSEEGQVAEYFYNCSWWKGRILEFDGWLVVTPFLNI